MPIQRNRNAVIIPPSYGELRKGSVKGDKRPGQDLTYFRFTPKNPGDKELQEAFDRLYGKTPNGIRFLFPTDKIDDFFFRFCEEYDNKGNVKHFCDGVNIYLRDKRSGEWVATAEYCPYSPLGPRPQKRPIDNQGKELGCQPRGRMSILLPDLILETGRVGTVRVLTGSDNDIRNMEDAFYAAQQRYGSVVNIPFVLRRAPEKVSTPGGRVPKWFIYIEDDPEYFRAWLDRNRAFRLTDQAQAERPMLSAPSPEVYPATHVPSSTIEVSGRTVDADTGEIVEDEVPEPLTDKERENVARITTQCAELVAKAWEYGFELVEDVDDDISHIVYESAAKEYYLMLMNLLNTEVRHRANVVAVDVPKKKQTVDQLLEWAREISIVEAALDKATMTELQEMAAEEGDIP